jgi:hypothetical protein
MAFNIRQATLQRSGVALVLVASNLQLSQIIELASTHSGGSSWLV